MYDEIKFLMMLAEQETLASYKLNSDEEPMVESLIEKGLVEAQCTMGVYYCLTKAGEILVAVIKKALE